MHRLERLGNVGLRIIVSVEITFPVNR
jgi:hypothetical protein